MAPPSGLEEWQPACLTAVVSLLALLLCPAWPGSTVSILGCAFLQLPCECGWVAHSPVTLYKCNHTPRDGIQGCSYFGMCRSLWENAGTCLSHSGKYLSFHVPACFELSGGTKKNPQRTKNKTKNTSAGDMPFVFRCALPEQHTLFLGCATPSSPAEGRGAGLGYAFGGRQCGKNWGASPICKIKTIVSHKSVRMI